MTEPNALDAAFRALRSAIPSTAKAVNIYQRQIGEAVETLYAFHDVHRAAECALDGAQRGGFIRGVTFARDLMPAHPTAWIVADAFEMDP